MNEIRAGWRPLLSATLGTMCGIFAFTNYTQGFFVGPVTAEFGWTPAQFFLSYTVLMCLGLITGPVIGSLAAKYGIRVLGIIGLVGSCVGLRTDLAEQRIINSVVSEFCFVGNF